jgi:hypothetical protein
MAFRIRVACMEMYPDHPGPPDTWEGIVTDEADSSGTPLLYRPPPEAWYTTDQVRMRGMCLRLLDAVTPAIETILRDAGLPFVGGSTQS